MQRLSHSHEFKEPVAHAQRFKAYSGKDPLRNLIGLPGIGRRYTVHAVWTVWNSTLRNLDVWHKGLTAAKYRLKIQPHYDGWAGTGFTKYRYFREIGEEIDRRLEVRDGLSVEYIVDRLDVVRLSIRPRSSVQGLTKGLRNYRGFVPFAKRKVAIEISSELVKQFDTVCYLSYC
jgi:hypothetical protein